MKGLRLWAIVCGTTMVRKLCWLTWIGLSKYSNLFRTRLWLVETVASTAVLSSITASHFRISNAAEWRVIWKVWNWIIMTVQCDRLLLFFLRFGKSWEEIRNPQDKIWLICGAIRLYIRMKVSFMGCWHLKAVDLTYTYVRKSDAKYRNNRHIIAMPHSKQISGTKKMGFCVNERVRVLERHYSVFISINLEWFGCTQGQYS